MFILPRSGTIRRCRESRTTSQRSVFGCFTKYPNFDPSINEYKKCLDQLALIDELVQFSPNRIWLDRAQILSERFVQLATKSNENIVNVLMMLTRIAKICYESNQLPSDRLLMLAEFVDERIPIAQTSFDCGEKRNELNPMIHSIWWLILALFLLSHTIGQKLQPTQTIDDPSKNRQCETLRTNSSDSILFIGLVRNNKLLIILKNFHLFEIPFSDNETKQINLVGEKTVPFSERFDSLHQDDRFRQLYEKQYIQTSFTMNWRNRLRIIFSIENYQSKSNIEYYFDWNLVSTNRFEAKNLHPDFDEKFAEKKIKRIFPLSSSQQNYDDSILFLILKDDFITSTSKVSDCMIMNVFFVI
ncbi:hypothetical protein SSS_03372 [Sarcoptes scabiei]|uniref:Uncharacterized protein n=1 Tax=Sarcoptes scabiei TaxID=52283 RepID=A0A834VIW1_SARSC|nr:hypothetical protein SSS_03372 [Sarcoptes scabiei]